MRAILGLGGNIGDPRATMAAALHLLDADAYISVTGVSSLYSTPPWGITDQPDFLNAVAIVETRLQPRALLQRCLDVEQELHRVRDKRWGPRSVDLDILTYGDIEISEPGIEIPHPRMMDRAFALVPLLELVPNLVVRGVRLEDRLAEIGREGVTPAAGPEWWRS